MVDQRKNVKVAPLVKLRIDEVKKAQGFKTESESIAYLVAAYLEFYPKITLPVQSKLLDQASEMNNQVIF